MKTPSPSKRASAVGVSPGLRVATVSHPPTRRSDTREGFALFLVLITLALMFLLCITYLRVMRVFSTQAQVIGGGNIGIVVDALDIDIAKIIGQDGNLNTAEPHDYPWTCSRMNAPCVLHYPYSISFTGALGDPLVDDSWLSPIEPENGKWAQVTNLYGSFVDTASSDFATIGQNPVTFTKAPSDVPAGAAVQGVANGRFIAFQNLDTTAGSADYNRMVDTDGDGVPDALWFIPPQSMQPNSNERYLAAVRIIDASALLNINTALSEASQPTPLGTAPGTRSGTPRKGEGPYEVDASPILGAMPSTSKTFRQGSVSQGPSGRAPADWTDWDYWWASGANVTNQGNSQTSNRYANAIYETQLRDCNPNHSWTSDGTTATQLWSDYPTLGTDANARKYVTTISGCVDVVPALPYAPDRDPNSAGFARARRPFDIYGNQNNINIPVPTGGYPAITGGVSAVSFTNGAWWDQAQFWYDGDYGVTDFLKGIDANAYGNAALTTNTDNDLTYPFPAGFRYALRNQGATWWARPLVFQRQMACNLAAALGRDNIVRRDNYSEWAGLEPLPVLTEFYAQMPYVAMSPSFLPATPTTAVVFPGRTLAEFATAADLPFVILGGNNFGAMRPAGGAYFFTNSGSDITFQPQYNDGTYIRGCKVKLTQSGTDVVGTVLYSKYILSSSAPLGYYDFDTGGTLQPVATAYNATGYGASLGQATTNASTGGNYSTMYWNTTARRSAAATPVDVTYPASDWRYNLSATGGSSGVGSYAFELANPYDFPVRLCNLRFDFKRFDYGVPFENYAFGGRNSAGAITPAAPANAAHSTSADLSTYIDALPSAPNYISGAATKTLTRDAEGYWVLRPNERIVFYRNGFDGKNPNGTDRRKPFGGTPDVSGLIAPDCYKVDLGADPAVPDLNGHPSTWRAEYFEIQARNQDRSGSVWNSWNGNWDNNTWVPWQHVVYRTLPSGWDATAAPNMNAVEAETNIPAGRQACPGDLVYRQVDVRTFGVAEKLDCLQARPMRYPSTAWGIMPVDLGDCEYRTNYYAGVISGTLSGRLFPTGSTVSTATGWMTNASSSSFFYDNTATTLALGSSKGLPCWQYDSSLKTDASPTLPDRGSISALGRLGKVGWEQPGPDGVLGTGDDFAGGPNGQMAAYGTITPPALTNRQRIRDEVVNWNYIGLPDDPAYPGTFPELTAANNANKDVRTNAAAATPNARRDGLPRTLDLLKVPLVSNFVHYPGITGNANYRGITSGQNWGNVPMPSTSPWIGSAWQNTLGDALNFYLMQDTQNLGLRGLCLRTDVKWFDWPNAATKYKVYNGATPYPLAYAGTTPYVSGMEALYNGEIYQAQQTITGTAPDPTPVTGNVGPVGSGKPWSISNGSYAQASQFWQLSWGEILGSRWQVDSPKYQGATGNNGANFKPGLINLNTAPRAVLKCLSLPTGADADTVADAIIAARKSPAAGATIPGGPRQGLVLASEAFGPDGLKSYTTSSTLTSGAGTSKFYTNDLTKNLEVLSWLPQQASCRSDVFIAYIVVQGYPKDDFSLGPIEHRRQTAVLVRDATGNAATLLSKVTSSN